jgi:hypothetical protein
LVGLGAGLEEEVTDVELGRAEGGGLVGADRQAGQGQEVVVGGVANQEGQYPGLSFLFGGERGGHEASATGAVTDKLRRSPFVSKQATNFRDAHTGSAAP